MLGTNYYTVGSAATDEVLALDVDGDGTVVLSRASADRPPRHWLFTLVGADIFQVATCFNGRPLCLELVDGRHADHAHLAKCAEDPIGTAAWWSTSRILPHEGVRSFEFGSDGVGMLQCLGTSFDPVHGFVPTLRICNHDDPHERWHLNATSARHP
jgi:hypothetical protein